MKYSYIAISFRATYKFISVLNKVLTIPTSVIMFSKMLMDLQMFKITWLLNLRLVESVLTAFVLLYINNIFRKEDYTKATTLSSW